MSRPSLAIWKTCVCGRRFLAYPRQGMTKLCQPCRERLKDPDVILRTMTVREKRKYYGTPDQ